MRKIQCLLDWIPTLNRSKRTRKQSREEVAMDIIIRQRKREYVRAYQRIDRQS